MRYGVYGIVKCKIYGIFLASKKAAPLKSAALFGRTVRTCLRSALSTDTVGVDSKLENPHISELSHIGVAHSMVLDLFINKETAEDYCSNRNLLLIFNKRSCILKGDYKMY